MHEIRFGVLGPIMVRHNRNVVTPRSSTMRAALGALLIAENRPLSVDRVRALVRPDRVGDNRVWAQVVMSRLRSWLTATFGESVSLHHGPGGYVFTVLPEQVDLGRFRRISATAQLGGPKQRLASWEEAVLLWRGGPLADIEGAHDGLLQGLEQLRLSAVLGLADAALSAGAPDRALPHVALLAQENSLDERLHAMWALLLARTGRQADAMEVIQRIGRTLIEELGIGIGEYLRHAQQTVLRSWPPAVIGTARVSPRDETIFALATQLKTGRPHAGKLAHDLNGNTCKRCERGRL